MHSFPNQATPLNPFRTMFYKLDFPFLCGDEIVATTKQHNTSDLGAKTPSQLFKVTLEDLEKKKANPSPKKRPETVKIDAPAKTPPKK